MSEIFDPPCLKELQQRWNGNTTLGPAKLFMQHLCTIEDLKITPTVSISRKWASIIISLADALIMLIFTWAIIKLKLYEKLTIHDLRGGKMRIEDFSVCIENIPINP